jgi:flagellar hook assembly protein FlgD
MASDQVIPRSEQLQIDGIRLNPPVFYAPETNRLTIEYLLNAPKVNIAEVTIEIFDFSNRRVHTLLSQEPRRIGRNAEQWDGQTDSGETVLNGRYVLVIIAKANGETAVSRKLLIVFK